jgi:bifunctional DNA-binding transcriptional regulator/antitoxin component of YhaV-PrlF toxin-antitoxin module
MLSYKLRATLSKKGLMTTPGELRRKTGLKESSKIGIIDLEGLFASASNEC